MKYICIDEGAVTALISGREYQSIDFAEASELIDTLSGKLETGRVEFLIKQRESILFLDNDGAFLMTLGNWKKKRYVVIDCEQSLLFTQLPSHQSLTTFQKLLRFCAKYWSGGVYNNSEKIISRSSKAVIFPLPFTTATPFRVTIEREPMKERLRKRGLDGNFLLVYRSGRHAMDSVSDFADETNFRRVFNRLPSVYSDVADRISEIEKKRDDHQLASTSLDNAQMSSRSFHLPYNRWMPLLTGKQKKFISADHSTPHRLDGAAGTGKTISLILRTIRVLREAEGKKKECHALLITHSEATREAIRGALYVIDEDNFQLRERSTSRVSLSVETLASLCAVFLQQRISEAEFVDRDAQDSKVLQQLYIEQAISEARKSEFSSFKPHLSDPLRLLFEDGADADLASLFQHEISVLIKGRAGDSFSVYKNCPSLKYGLPVESDGDKGFVFSVFRGYQRQLESYNQFDTDDVVISTVGQLDTPIWRRRRLREGYDFIAIDETHLFNINELHIFHHFSREAGKSPISFTVDHAQAVGDRGWNDGDGSSNLLDLDVEGAETTSMNAVFRSSPDIREFCHTILASGATLFTNFVNTLSSGESAFTSEDERRSQRIRYIEYADDAAMVEGAFQRAETLRQETGSSRPDVLITSLSEELIGSIRELAEKTNKGITILERRGDFMQIRKAESSAHFILSHADFVGGLEFGAVVIVGVDRGRVPYEGETFNSNSRNFASYTAHNRLYVASSRARFALNILGVKSRGASSLLKGAARDGLIDAVA